MKAKWIILPVLIAGLFSCRLVIEIGTVAGSGWIVTESRAVSGFDQVKLAGTGDIRVVPGYSDGLTVEADENLQRYITAEVLDRTLVISVRTGFSIHPSRAIRYTVTARNFTAFELSGQGSANLSGLNTENFTLKLSGQGDVTAATGSPINYLNVILSGQGTIDLSALKSRTVYATLSGMGDITLWTTDYLNALISGFGDIAYWGYPYTDESVTGSGRIIWLGDKW